jgi:hypothetical protein
LNNQRKEDETESQSHDFAMAGQICGERQRQGK